MRYLYWGLKQPSLSISILYVLCTLSLSCSTPSTQRPNIILIMADDMGFSDIGAYGSEIQTPNIDRLAAEGVRFNNFYNGARCCPTRASLMTGLYAHQAGMGGMEPDRGLPGYRGNINQQCVTVAEALKLNGYETYMTGKWHLTRNTQAETLEEKFNWPNQRGFDHFFGTIAGAGNFFNPATLTEDNRTLDPKDFEDFYYTDAIGNKATEYIKKHEGSAHPNPFFMYVAFTAPHWPLHAREADIAKYRQRYLDGWDQIRQERYRKMLELGIIDKSVILSERDPRVPAWDSIEVSELPEEVQATVSSPDEFRKLMAEKMAVYAAMVDRMDQNIGKILTALNDQGLKENTLIVFLSDNGGADEWGTYGYNWKGYAETGILAGPEESNTSYGPAWAHVSNTPFRYYKLYTYEGGISTPFIMSWPEKIQPDPNIKTTISHIIDVMPTFLDAASAEYPDYFKDQEILPLQGKSLLPVAIEDKTLEERPLFWEHITGKAVRMGPWKLMTRRTTTQWQLYNMENDRSELNNLADQYPDKVKEMSASWEQWANNSNVLPWPEAFQNWIKDDEE